MRKIFNIVLLVSAVLPVVLLLWPYANWNAAMSLIFRVVPAVCVQILLIRLTERKIIQLLPLILTGGIAAWGIYLYFVSPDWVNATWWGLTADYISPLIGCAAVFVIRFISLKEAIE